MRDVKLHPYILLGASVRYLLDVREGLPISQGANSKEIPLVHHMNRVSIYLESMGLSVSHRAFEAELGELRNDFKRSTQGAVLSKQQADMILEHMRTIADIVKHEAADLKAYVIPEKRLSIDKLLSNVNGLFGEGVFLALPDMAQFDFAQAGKCIAFEVPTAAAFHILRGTEDVLRSYYTALVQPITTNMTWAPLVTGLRGVTPDSPPRELLDNLNNIRESFRNPTQHPQKRYDVDEAQDLFNLCVDVVNRMAKDLFRRKIWVSDDF